MTKIEEKYPEKDLTKEIIGCAFKVFKELGYGLAEKVYQSAMSECLLEEHLKYNRESYGFITFNGKRVGKYYLDFLVENKIAVELKVRNEIYITDSVQLLNYMKSENLKVGLLIVFTKNGVKIKRLIN